ncbi:transglutaminase-like cysteine peptidase [Andreprevotia chitinilytica]|uniref:transglutaminase-like cysteine peptidase n=1 Tax=Andreprevotia chitinilytica TaxID=396808 RepID=UPI00068B2807|nr:transglutaminase-like cysteine peptidase [Andreprevotia chitinilytica]
MTFRSSPASAYALAALLLAALAWPVRSEVDQDKLLQTITQRFGAGSAQALQGWQTLVAAGKTWAEADKLKRVNEYINRRITFDTNLAVWGKDDYWATPMETLGKNAADCKGFTLIKFFTLKEMGVPEEKMRLTYVRAKLGGADSNVTQAHMVLAYYPTPDAEPLVLDNLLTEIRPASRRPDLLPVFSFNTAGVYTGTNQATASIDRLSRWKDLLERARAEGFKF